ncbi:stage V sporulation protein K [Virgibacillus necropolis]|uniref:stage V sporulation protein K n=1 Tax=Virgibacillus necropolis TaxID=163877 RepID=UPI00384F04D3
MESQKMQNKNGQINIVLYDKEGVKVEPDQRQRISYNESSPFYRIDQEFSSFVGMDYLKHSIKEIYAMITINEKRKQVGLNSSNQVLHMLFKGNPGTGKTTIARKLASVYYDMNILSKGHFIEAERADLVGEYIGQTAQKTRAIIQKAAGGILFIDEAYSLARGGEKDFGKEAIDTLVKHMEDDHDDFVLILAGYPYEMERFLLLNPGLKSRFPFILDFQDYAVDQLLQIAKKMLQEREYQLTNEAEWKLREQIILEKNHSPHNFSNARFVRNVIEQSIRKQAMRILKQNKISTDTLITLTRQDLVFDKLSSY